VAKVVSGAGREAEKTGGVSPCSLAVAGGAQRRFWFTSTKPMSVRALARQLGLSPTAVSLALRGSPRISAAVRARVERAARAAGHVPNARLSELMREVRRSAKPQY